MKQKILASLMAAAMLLSLAACGGNGAAQVSSPSTAGTSDLAPLDQQAEMLHEMFPDAKNVGLLYCSGEPNSVYQVEVVSEALTGMGYTCANFAFSPM